MTLSISSAPRGRAHPPVVARSRGELRNLLQSFDPALDLESLKGRTALVLLAGLQAEHNVVKLARFAGLETALVSRCARRFFDNGVWFGGKTICAWGADGRNLQFFWADVAVGEGKLCRRMDSEARLEWAPQGQWWKSFEHTRGGETELGILYHVPDIEDPTPPAVVARSEQSPGAAADRADLFPGAAWL